MASFPSGVGKGFDTILLLKWLASFLPGLQRLESYMKIIERFWGTMLVNQ